MFKLFKDSFKTTNDCIILATPLIILSSFWGWYCTYTLDFANTLPKLLLAIATVCVMGGAFLSVWLYMVKKVIPLASKIFVFDRDRAKALWEIATLLPQGSAKFFVPILSVIAFYLLIYGTSAILICNIVSKIFPAVDFFNLKIGFPLISSVELFKALNDLPKEQLYGMIISTILIALIVISVTFWTILWIPEIVHTERRPFLALKKSIGKLRLRFKEVQKVFLHLLSLAVLLTICILLLMVNPYLFFAVLILFYYFIVYLVVLLFLYYEQQFT